jgi:adenylate cyclase
MPNDKPNRRLAAILAADVVGFSRLMGMDEEGTLARVVALRREIIEPKIGQHRGRVFKLVGDGILIEFASAVDAVRCAVDVQRAVTEAQADAPENRRISYRIGINAGDVIADGEDLYGEGVNVAVRLEALAELGGICVSGLVRDSVRSKVEAAFVDLGEQRVKNITEPVRVFRVEYGSNSAGDRRSAAAVNVEAVLKRPAVAVLPFSNLGGDPGHDYFADGLTDEIITALSQWRWFPVVASNSSFTYKGRAVKVQDVARELGVRYVVEGAVRRDSNRVRVTAQLIDGTTGRHVWAEKMDRELCDVFALQDELTRKIAATVTPELERAELERNAKVAPESLEAWDWVLRGMAHLAVTTKESTERAREMFGRALELDPACTRAFVGFAWSHHRDISSEFTRSREDSVAQCLAAARRAVELDELDSSAHWCLGAAYCWAGELELAVSEQRRAVELNPSNTRAYLSLGLCSALAGYADEAIRNLEIGLRLNPSGSFLHMYLGFVARAHFVAGRYQAAAEWARRAEQRNPNDPEHHLLLAASFGFLGRLEEGGIEIDLCESLRPGYVAAGGRYYMATDKDRLLEGLHRASGKR